MPTPPVVERRMHTTEGRGVTVPSTTNTDFQRRLDALEEAQRALFGRRAERMSGNGVFDRYREPILTAAHVPLFWRYDLDPARNPLLLERMAVNAVFNAGAIKLGARYLLVARVEGAD